MTGSKRGGAAAAAMLCASAACAGPLVITPTTVTIAPERHSAVVEVENSGDDTVDLQFRAYDWRQEGGEDRLTPTDALIVSPAIATLGPHARQLFRVMQVDAAPAAAGAERSYRLRLNQLPRGDAAAVAVLLEFSLPVFQSARDASPRLHWAWGPDGVTVTNTGGRRVRFSRLALQAQDGAPAALASAGAAYLLGGASRTFRLAEPGTTLANARLVGLGDTGPIDVAETTPAAR